MREVLVMDLSNILLSDEKAGENAAREDGGCETAGERRLSVDDDWYRERVGTSSWIRAGGWWRGKMCLGVE
jgi:hypothetical protein